MKKILKNKKLTIILLVILISALIGLFFISILKDSNKEIITNALENYLETIKNNKINYQSLFIKSLINNIIIILIIWILGISLIGIPIVLILLIIKTFSITFTYTSIISIYKLKGIILSSIYIIPHIFNLFIIFLLSYYSINFSSILFNNLFKQKSYNKTLIIKRYIKLLIISIIFTILSSLLETFIIPSLIKYIYF